MKANKSIRQRLFQYLIGFVVLIVTVLFFVQTVFLEDFYKIIKRSEIQSMAEDILEHSDEDFIEDYLSDTFYRGEMCVHLVDADGNILFSSDRYRDCSVRRMSQMELAALYASTLEEPDRESASVTVSTRNLGEPQLGGNRGNRLRNAPGQEQMMYVKGSDDGRMVIIESMLSPMKATMSVLRVQLFYATGILILAAGALAMILSKKIAQPIIDINHSAKKLIAGSYDLELSEKAYREIIELNTTMHDTSRELKKADKLQKELIANVSHDLRTPLTMIIGYAEVMRDLPNENTQENVQVIIDEAQRLSRLVNDILEISKSSAEIRQLKREPMDLTRLVGDIVERCGKLTEAEGYWFEFEPTEAVMVNGDEGRLSQVIYNLIGNAISHTGDDKKIIIRQEICRTKEKRSVRICVIDTGEGIAPEFLADIWERYYKVDQTHIRSTVGTGLGLSIVKNIITAHNGGYGVDSELGKGSSFWIELPII